MAYFIYCRKSTEAEDRQILSIESQMQEMRRLAEQRGLHVLETLTEAQSAKDPGRPVFQQMMARLARGEAEGILCWRLDRLARNPVDGGSVIWAIKQQAMTIVTPTQTFSQALDNTILMYIEFGMAQKFVDDLSRNVKRGLKTKAEQGWYPGFAPLGYLNEPAGKRGTRRILPDPDRFPLVRRMWDLLLSGAHGVSEIRRIANEEWGFRTRSNRREQASPLSLSGLYDIFSNPFYSGDFEYPRGSGLWYSGVHEAMISKEEYEGAQNILGRPGRPRPKTHRFPFTGMIRCGACSGVVTAEEKWKHQKNGKVHHYIYYHCTKRKIPRCSQPSIERSALELFVLDRLRGFSITPALHEWALDAVSAMHEEDKEQRAAVIGNIKKTIANVEAQLTELVRMRARQIIDDMEFERERTSLQVELRRLQDPEEYFARQADTCLSETRQIFDIARRACEEFTTGDDTTKKALLNAVSSNLTLRDKILAITLKNVFELLERRLAPFRRQTAPFEPPKEHSVTGFLSELMVPIPTWCGIVEDVRTCVREEVQARSRLDFGPSEKHRGADI